MYKNQLQELAQRSCFNLPSYVCIREGPDHAPRFKAKVNFNGETFESPAFCSTLRQAEHAAAEVALHVLSKKSPSKALAARVLDETGVYKNLLQETAHRAGLKLPVYTTIRSGPSHVPVFSCTVELAGMSFTGEAAKTKKQAQKNAAITAWAALKKLSKPGASSSSSATSLESGGNDQQEQVTVARYLAATQPAETNKSVRDGRLRQCSAPVRSDLISHGRGGSLYSLRCKDWAYSQFWPKGPMHQIWPQERACHQWNPPLVLSSVPSSPTEPQVFPFIQPSDQADQRHYFVGQEQEPISPLLQIRPFLHFSNHSVSASVRSVSQITIQEVEEESQAKQEWLIDDGDCDCWKPPNAAGFSPTAVASSFCSLRRHSEQMLQEKDEEIGQSLPHIGNSTQLESNQTELYHQISQGITDARFRPRTINAAEANFLSQSSYTSEDMNFQLRNSHSFDHLHSDVRQKNIPVVSSARSGRASVPDFLVAPVTVTKIGALSGGIRSGISIPLTRAPLPMRAAASACLPKPWLAGVKDNQGIPSAKFMAPAVHIRSVIPVCSAPCAKKFPTPSQGHVSQVERKNTKEPGGNIAAASSDLGNLRI